MLRVLCWVRWTNITLALWAVFPTKWVFDFLFTAMASRPRRTYVRIWGSRGGSRVHYAQLRSPCARTSV